MTGPSMFERALGDRFARLPAAVRRFHRLRGRHPLRGWVETQAPSSTGARLLGRWVGTPLQASSGPILFELDAAPDQERWTRHFPGRTMRSRLRLVAGQLEERLGPARLKFTLATEDSALSLQLARLYFLGIPCPRRLQPVLVAREHGDADALHFEISAALPWIGTVAHYRGWLQLEDAA